MIQTVLLPLRRILNGSPNYEIQFTDRDPLKVYLNQPDKVRTRRGVAYQWKIEVDGKEAMLTCLIRLNQQRFDESESFKALVEIEGDFFGTVSVEPIPS